MSRDAAMRAAAVERDSSQTTKKAKGGKQEPSAAQN